MVAVQPWIAAETRQPFLATGAQLSEQVYVAQVRDGRQLWCTLRARQTADRRGWVVGHRPLAWAPTHWAPVPEIERKLNSMLANAHSAILRLPDFVFAMSVGLDEHGEPRPDGPGVVRVQPYKGELIGRISGGMFHFDRRCERGLVESVLQAAREPMPEALRYARYSCACCFCGRPLTDPESRRLGIGPTCRGYASGGRRK
jgi:hypothetical protein